VAQHAVLDVTHAAIRIDQFAGLLVAGNGIEGEVAALQVLFQRHRRVGVDHEAAVAAAGLALGARQRMFLAGIRMQEYREVLAHGAESQCFHLRLGGADHHPVPVAGHQAQQRITNRATDEIDLHAHMMPRCARCCEPGDQPGQVNALVGLAMRPCMRSVSGTALPLRRQS
jgi:hypothetical protein